LIALLAWSALFASFSPMARGQTYSVVLSINDPRPMGEAVLSLTRSYPVTITYEDPRYEYSGDLRDVTRQVSKTRHPQVRAIVPKGGAFHATYDVSQDTGEPVDMAGAIQAVIDANNLARHGGHFELLRSGETFHVVPTEVRDSKGRWIRQQSVLDTPITFSSGGERDFFALIPSIVKEASAASGQKIVSAGPSSIVCSLTCDEHKRTVDATNEPARDILLRLLHSMSPRYTWVLYYDPTMHYYVFNLVLGVERPEPKIEPYRPTQKPGDPTPAGVPFNVASAR
jgi:hypothetical protein